MQYKYVKTTTAMTISFCDAQSIIFEYKNEMDSVNSSDAIIII